jgi:hypothetical protein
VSGAATSTAIEASTNLKVNERSCLSISWYRKFKVLIAVSVEKGNRLNWMQACRMHPKFRRGLRRDSAKDLAYLSQSWKSSKLTVLSGIVAPLESLRLDLINSRFGAAFIPFHRCHPSNGSPAGRLADLGLRTVFQKSAWPQVPMHYDELLIFTGTIISGLLFLMSLGRMS